MKTQISAPKVFATFLMLLMVLHTVLSSCDCVSVENGSHFHDLVVTEKKEDFLVELVLLCSAARIGMLLTSRRWLHILSGAISLFVSVMMSLMLVIYSKVEQMICGFAWTHHTLTALGRWVLLLAWIIAVVHALFLAVLYWPKGKFRSKAIGSDT